MRALVTGATGFVGRHVIDALVAEGHEVHATFVEPSAPSIPAVVWHRADLLRDAKAVATEARCDVLVHLAWYAVHGAFWNSLENLRWVASSLDLIREFQACGGTRVVCAGSCAEYDWSTAGALNELRSPCTPSTLYGTSKDAFRRMVEAFAKETGMSWAWGRIFFLYGPGEDERRFIPTVARALVRGENPKCTHGRQVRDFMHVRDVATAFARLASSEVRGPINIASGHGVTLASIAHALERITGSQAHAELGAIEAPASEPSVIVADAQRMRDELGFRPSIELEDGLVEVVRSLRDPT